MFSKNEIFPENVVDELKNLINGNEYFIKALISYISVKVIPKTTKILTPKFKKLLKFEFAKKPKIGWVS